MGDRLYAYCVGDERMAGTVESVTGIQGAQPEIIQSGNLAAVVSEFDGNALSATRDNVQAHERVVRRVLAQTTPLPFRFGTIVDEKQLQSYLTSQRASLNAKLSHVRGCVEMSVKVIWDLKVRSDESARLETEARSERGTVETTTGSGTAFLVAKRREAQGESLLNERAAEIADWLTSSLGNAVRDTRATVQPKQPLVLAAAHLVERTRLEDYRAALQRARLERGELHFLTSGPWPPYSFAIISS